MSQNERHRNTGANPEGVSCGAVHRSKARAPEDQDVWNQSSTDFDVKPRNGMTKVTRANIIDMLWRSLSKCWVNVSAESCGITFWNTVGRRVGS